jgi:predicted RNase H-like nuclease
VATRVLGVDSCPSGWIGISLGDDGLAAWFGRTLAELVAAAVSKGPPACVAVDIPLGLPDVGRRRADAEVRALLSPRGSCVFDALTRTAYQAATHAEANALQRARTGKGLSQQAYRLGVKVLDANGFAALGSHVVIEAHPELCFARMGDGVVRAGKKTWAGQQRRRELLAAQGIDVDQVGTAGEAGLRAGPDDLLDAAAVAWTAARYVEGKASSYPEVPEVFSDGLPAAIWV